MDKNTLEIEATVHDPKVLTAPWTVPKQTLVLAPFDQLLPLICTGVETGPLMDAAPLRERLEREPVEVCLVLLVNTKQGVIGVHELGRGTLDSCLVHPREVFKAAVLGNAAGVIVAHYVARHIMHLTCR